MKKLTLMTTAAVVFLSMPALAEHARNARDNDRYDDTYKLRVQNEPNMKVETQTTTRTEIRPATRQEYALADSDKHIIVNGEAVYLVSESGMKYPAPKGDYFTTNGLTIVSDDGVWLRTEGPMETVFVDVNDTNKNGTPDQIRTRTY